MVTLKADSKRFGQHRNAFGFLRLFFASLVIIGHTPELIDGNREREPLTLLFGTISFGEVAVDAFFIISGYLITSSFLNSSSARSYLVKRIARIYPGFIAAYLACIFVVPFLADASHTVDYGNVLHSMPREILTLMRPEIWSVFAGSNYPNLNSPMWTIAYEFRCYLLVAVLGALGWLTRWPWLALAAVAAVVAAPLVPDQLIASLSHVPRAHLLGLDKVHDTLRTVGMFLAGMVFFALRDHIELRWRWCAVAAAGLILAFCLRETASAGMAICGSYLIFAAAAYGARSWVGRVNNETDISYGVYLYAWPIEKLIIMYQPHQPLSLIAIETLTASLICGALSWLLIEKPCLKMVRSPGKETSAGRS